MKQILAAGIAILCCMPVYANHIRGGELSYKYLGPGSTANTTSYLVILKLYIDCNATAAGQSEPTAPFTIFRRSDNSIYTSFTVNRTSEQVIMYDPGSNPCITNPPSDICYKLKYFETTVELPDNPSGYTIAYQRCCRIGGIENISGRSNDFGATYSCEIPGTNTLPLPEHNSSPLITGNDAVAICAGAGFTYDFSATDLDHDSLVYTLCNAYAGGGPTLEPATCSSCVSPNPASSPPYSSVPYKTPYSGSNPLGLNASIDPKSGIISGIAPTTTAQYVVSGCIYEYRKGKLINVHRKDIHLKVSDCNPLKAFLKPDYDYCDDFLVTFKNEQVNPAGSIFIWKYGDGTKTDTSFDQMGAIQHQFADTGTYTIKLKVILAGQCVDSTSTLAKVYPGFYPGFMVTGACLLNPLQFIDTTKTKYGKVNGWRWEFGDETTLADTARGTPIPTWKFSTIGTKTATLIVQSDKGCRDTVTNTVLVKDKPAITLPFKDTLICSNLPVQDTLLLQASGTGNFSWTPLTRIVNANTGTPLVFPTSTTIYQVQLNENGCINTDSVRVRVVDHVTLDAGPDSTICLTDAVTLHPSTNALKFVWSPAITINNATVKNPVVTPVDVTTTYYLIGSIGKCSIADDVTIRTAPYPTSDAGKDQAICFGDTAYFHASIVGSSFNWTPVSSLINPLSLSPAAHPVASTSYILAVYDVLGCPKPKFDTVLLTVRPPVIASAGRDTSVIVNQPLTLTATGAPLFLWTPATFLNHDDIQSPTAVFNASGLFTYAVKAYTVENCFAIDTIHIKVYQTKPDIFVPNAFTPGGAQNNLFRPIPVGISRLDYFRVYNRWGLMVFSSNDGTGWNGNYAGKEQASGTFIWVVQGRDYTGKIISKKGTMVLVR